MTEFVAGNDLESSADREAQSRNKRIPKANVVYIFSTRLEDEFAARFVAGQEAIEDAKVDTRCWPDFGRGRSTLAIRRRLDKVADKPACHAPKGNLLHWRIRRILEGGRHRCEIEFVGDTEMFKALSNAPGAGSGLPIELFLVESGNEGLRGLVIAA